MPFRARNLFYLRISKSDVIPLYLYLDERHIEWMSDRVLQHVLADLRPLIGPKMKAESQLTEGPSGKKGIVDVYRGDFYQFAYFFRGMEPHSVILKTRNFVAAPDRPKGQMLPSPSPEPARQSERGTKRKKSCASLKQKAKGKERARTRDINEDELEDFESEEDVISGDDDADYTPRHRSSRARRRPKRTTQEAIEVEDNFVDDADDTQMIEGTNQELIVKEETEDVLPATPAPDGHSQESSTTSTAGSRTINRVVINVDEEESKPKPILQLRYKGFSISGRYLCVIVEPWPPIRSASRAPSLAPLQSTGLRRPSIAPPDFVPSTGLRERTPLFLPDDDRGETPAPFLNSRVLPPVPAFNDPAPDQSIEGYDESDMMAFSQVLHSAGDLRGIEVDDDDIDGAVLFGDADETREL